MSEAPEGGSPLAVQRAYDLTVWLLRKVEKFPRAHRYVLGDRLSTRALDLVELLTAAAYTSDKTAVLDQANTAVNSLRIVLRIAFTLELMGAGSEEYAAERLEEIGRMIGGWRKSSRRPPG